MIVSYSRKDSFAKNQDGAKKLWIKTQVERTFEDFISDKERPQLKMMMKSLHKGDIVLCHSLGMLAENLRDLSEIVETLHKKGVSIRFLKENLEFNPSGASSAMDTIPIRILKSLAQWEDAVEEEHRLASFALPKRVDVGRKKIDISKIQEVDILMMSFNLTVEEACKRVGISRATYYNHRLEVSIQDKPQNAHFGDAHAHYQKNKKPKGKKK